MPEKAKGKRFGCAAVALIIAAIWLAGGWFLYQAALKSPPKEKDGLSIRFSFIPDEEEDEDS